jgi:predicted RNase H-like nuclease
VRVLGVDLAWRERGRTGLCAIEGDRVLDSTTLGGDDEIVAWIERWAGDEVLVAIDAPLVVANASGRRPCEAVFGHVYAAAHAAAYPANLALPAFRSGVRAWEIARKTGLSVDPAATARGRRCAIEVYPHAALVSLFGLARTLKYKYKPGRSLDERVGAFARLLVHLETLRTFVPPLDVRTAPRWAALREAVTERPTAAGLARIEDELDAYVCAYVGLYHTAWEGTRSLTVGDGVAGYIVTPVDAVRQTTIRDCAARLGVAVA